MAKRFWGRVYYEDHCARILQEESAEKSSFAYDDAYLNNHHPVLAHPLFFCSFPHSSDRALPPFDNLMSEGCLENAQKTVLGKRKVFRFELLLAFGHDWAGGVSLRDPEPERLSTDFLSNEDLKGKPVLTSRASLSDVQPKWAIFQGESKYVMATPGGLRTHIAKLPSPMHRDLIINE